MEKQTRNSKVRNKKKRWHFGSRSDEEKISPKPHKAIPFNSAEKQAGVESSFQHAQRLSMVEQLGQVQGNRHLQNALTVTNQPTNEAQAPHRLVHSSPDGSLQTWTTVKRYRFQATIPCKPTAQAGEPMPTRQSRSDVPKGEEKGDSTYKELFARLGAVPAKNKSLGTDSVLSSETQATGMTSTQKPASAPISVPDIEIPALSTVDRNDAVNGNFGYKGSITRGGPVPAGFGETRSFSSKLTGILIWSLFGTFLVSATYEHPITYQVRVGAGPKGQKNIASENDASIKKKNYRKVVSDLTPDMSDLNGRPPRKKFWAEDLTIRHELVHANDDMSNGPGAMTTVTTWLNGQAAANAGDVQNLLAALPGRFADALLAALSTEDGEKHAYGDGAPSYQARADAIKAKGKKGEYK